MGILDDAIREHLDLKRRRGADPTEIEKLEREALGPVRRGTGDVQTAEAGLAEDELTEQGWDDGFEDGDLDQRESARDYAEAPETETDEHPTVAPESSPTQRQAPVDHDMLPPFEDSEAHTDPAPGSESSRTPPANADPETAVYDVEHAFDREHTEKTDDVLEETPEFLQDAPDDGRLWFEQRPPKDFDFDG